LVKPHLNETRINILVVDDEAALRNALARFLGKQGYKVALAASGEEALEQLERERASLMLLDIRMPGLSGIEVLPRALEIDPDLAIVMLTAVDDATSAAMCMQRGALDYLGKPLELTALERALTRALRRRDTMLQERGITTWLKEEVTLRTQELEGAAERQAELTVATLEALVNALEAKNDYLGGHSARVAAFAATIANELGLPDEEIDQVRTAGRLHDLGMIGIREAVLDKQGTLTEEEYEHVKQHVTIGAQILAPLVHLAPVVSFVKSHHERWDGGGYPEGLAGEHIPLGARIIGGAEVYDALTTNRPYMQSMSPEDAVKRMRELTGQVLDSSVMDALAAAIERRQTLEFLAEGVGPVA
jgi:response regulator RpfG family c-di-GMP phosphodiesterase